MAVSDIDNQNLHNLTLEKTKKKFYGHEVLFSKYEPQIPTSAEREYVRITNQYMKLLKDELETQLPRIKTVYKTERDLDVKENRRNDSATDLMLMATEVFVMIQNAITVSTIGFGLRRKLEAMANMNRKLTIKEWKKAVSATLGVDILDDYYLGDFYAEQMKIWVDNNVELITSIPNDTLSKMKDIVYDGYKNGKTTTRMTKEIQAAYGVGKRKAEFIARDQTAKLNGQIQRAQQQDAGITQYIWSTSGDARVRESHKQLNGKKCDWDNAPLNSDGRRCHPGEDYGCRCIGRPVFAQSTITLPLADDNK